MSQYKCLRSLNGEPHHFSITSTRERYITLEDISKIHICELNAEKKKNKKKNGKLTEHHHDFFFRVEYIVAAFMFINLPSSMKYA